MLSFIPPTSEEYRDYYFVISEDMNEIKSMNPYTELAGDAFWISKDIERKSEFHTTWRNGKVEGTPFPDTNSCMMNMVFRKVSSSGVDVVRPDPK